MVEMFLVREIGEKPDCWVRFLLAFCGASPPSCAHYAQAGLFSPTFTTPLGARHLQALGCVLFAAAYSVHPFANAGNLAIINARF